MSDELGGPAEVKPVEMPARLVNLPPNGTPLKEIIRHSLIEALKMSNWNQTHAANLLSISPRAMNYQIKTLGIEIPNRRRQKVET
jgi:transcriptional regulator with GAF, ATPase, and Fis domain